MNLDDDGIDLVAVRIFAAQRDIEAHLRDLAVVNGVCPGCWCEPHEGECQTDERSGE